MMRKIFIALSLLGVACITQADMCDIQVITENELSNFGKYFQIPEDESVELILSKYPQCIDQASLIVAYLYLDSASPFHSILKAVSYLKQSVEMGNEQAAALLGSLFISNERVYNLEEGIELLEFASSNGVNLAMINLFTLSRQGKYDSEKGVQLLENAYKNGYEKAVLYYGHYLHLKSVATGQHALTADAIAILEEFDFIELSGDRHFYLTEIYMDKRTAHYDSAKAVQHWTKAIEEGHERAISLWKSYEKASQQND
ncbi:hypothetical protein Q3O59_02755 [Alkalimonas delamerensis]|uniref:Sel1 repeat family protein n=1 Tax=Alkalimonas delamerensis TaxID=265981 RepID=A0ABT9GLW3_9GAMM|nr:hypothetical protein [Alkalimonas delamerensis]MDP4527955.1 hypothetical protein [Alkalimonas delamerensis]